MKTVYFPGIDFSIEDDWLYANGTRVCALNAHAYSDFLEFVDSNLEYIREVLEEMGFRYVLVDVYQHTSRYTPRLQSTSRLLLKRVVPIDEAHLLSEPLHTYLIHLFPLPDGEWANQYSVLIRGLTNAPIHAMIRTVKERDSFLLDLANLTAPAHWREERNND